MLKVVLLLVGLASARLVAPGALQANRTTTAEDYWQQWTQFQKDHGKTYETKVHHDERFNIFMDNIDKINTHNAKKLSWTLGVNQFADLTAEEFKAQTACMMPSRPRMENPKVLDESATPDSIDWEAEGKITPVKNQGQCGSCWAFSTTGSVEGRVAIANKADPVSLSEQELVDCGGSEGNQGCNGGLMDYGFKYVEKEHGLCTESSYPYRAKTQKFQCNSRRSSCTHVDAISSYQDVTSNSASQLEAAVAQGPVSIAIEADQSAFQLYHSGVFSGRCGTKLDHGVLVVGYGTMNGEKYWKVKNSWGASWGSKGYIYLCRDCGKNGRKGQCGLLGQPSYPVV